MHHVRSGFPDSSRHGWAAAGIDEVKRRLVVAPAKYIIKVIDKEGIRVLAEV
jgi:hypothetical protein